jgi:hypothetical protein
MVLIADERRDVESIAALSSAAADRMANERGRN